GRLYGRGACDTKGSVATFLSALCELAKSNARPQETEIIFAGLVDEEHAQAGSRAFVAWGRRRPRRRISGVQSNLLARMPALSDFRADLAIVGEPTRLQVVTAHKGSAFVSLETRGKAAHGSTPQFGRN